MPRWIPETSDDVLIGVVRSISREENAETDSRYRVTIDAREGAFWIPMHVDIAAKLSFGDHLVVQVIPRPKGIGYETFRLETRPAYAIWRWGPAPYTGEGVWTLLGQPMARYTAEELAHDLGRPVDELRPQ